MMTESVPYRDEDWLREKYLEEGLSFDSIGDICGVCGGTIRKWAKRFGIESRPHNIPDGGEDYRYKDKDWLRGKYRFENLGPTAIVEEYNLPCCPATVYNWIDRFGLVQRHRDSEWLREKYEEECLSTIKIADICDVSPETVSNNLKDFNIEVRTHSNKWDFYTPPLEGVTGEDHPMHGLRGDDFPSPRLFGEDNPNWRGGGGYRKPEWRNSTEWEEVRKEILRRDSSTCQSCGGGGNHVHHIVPVSEGGEKFDNENLEVLCEGCHIDVHSK